MLSTFERRQHRNRRRDGAVAIDQRRAEQTRHDDRRTPHPFDAEQRHQGQDAALAVIVDAHRDEHVFDRRDDKQRPDHQRQDAEDAIRRGVAAEKVERGFERIERARADIAEHDAERRQPGSASAPLLQDRGRYHRPERVMRSTMPAGVRTAASGFLRPYPQPRWMRCDTIMSRDSPGCRMNTSASVQRCGPLRLSSRSARKILLYRVAIHCRPLDVTLR